MRGSRSPGEEIDYSPGAWMVGIGLTVAFLSMFIPPLRVALWTW
jgi:hypothetical protein